MWTWMSSLDTLAAEMSKAESWPAGKCLMVSPSTATRVPLPSITSTVQGEPVHDKRETITNHSLRSLYTLTKKFTNILSR
ncbi:hypothetical protein E2C01_092058 [Portunus trituberculatus]|uniref:Uncharacterized protein n=1 Tax=Portunus trituberculatus TaxID=210409 RepID=A0A5B7JFJ8_PORTR|nr:hypothetical protein [Portunus trituberculatus]